MRVLAVLSCLALIGCGSSDPVTSGNGGGMVVGEGAGGSAVAGAGGVGGSVAPFPSGAGTTGKGGAAGASTGGGAGAAGKNAGGAGGGKAGASGSTAGKSGSGGAPTTTGGSGGSGAGTAGKGASSGSGQSGSGQSGSGQAGSGQAGSTQTGGASGSSATGCGWKGEGTPLHVGPNLDVCMPKVVCNAETCPPALGSCVNGACQYKPGYEGIATVPEAWATYYCTLSTGGCHGVTQVDFPEVTAAKIAKDKGLPLCEGASGNGPCIGIAASNPMVVGNSQLAVDPVTGAQVTGWGQGLTEASGLCYELSGPGGTAIVALTDRCGGYCKCKGSGYQECGPCVNAADMEPNCACVGPVPGLYTNCCGLGCQSVKQDCDWCASNNHPHFDLDTGTFNHLCGAKATDGSCKIDKVAFVPCVTAGVGWPPGGGGGSCKTGSFSCTGPMPNQVEVPTNPGCCCNWNLTPQPDGTCK